MADPLAGIKSNPTCNGKRDSLNSLTALLVGVAMTFNCSSPFLRRVLTLLLGCLLAQSTLAAPGLIRFNVSPNGYPPYTIVSSQGKVSGIMWEVLTTIAARHGYKVKAEKIPRKRVDRFILGGRLDATARAREWTSHPERFIFTAPVVQAEEVFFSTSDRPVPYESPQSLKGKTLVTHLGYHYPKLRPFFDSGAIRRFDVRTDTQMFYHLLAGEQFQVLVAERHVGQWIIRQNRWNGRFVYSAQHPLTRLGFPLMFAPRWKSFVKVFNRDLERMKQNGELERILGHYR